MSSLISPEGHEVDKAGTIKTLCALHVFSGENHLLGAAEGCAVLSAVTEENYQIIGR